MVIVGGGLTAGFISRQLTSKGVQVVVLERGGDHRNGPEAKIPTQRDELRWDVHADLAQDSAVQDLFLAVFAERGRGPAAAGAGGTFLLREWGWGAQAWPLELAKPGAGRG